MVQQPKGHRRKTFRSQYGSNPPFDHQIAPGYILLPSTLSARTSQHNSNSKIDKDGRISSSAVLHWAGQPFRKDTTNSWVSGDPVSDGSSRFSRNYKMLHGIYGLTVTAYYIRKTTVSSYGCAGWQSKPNSVKVLSVSQNNPRSSLRPDSRPFFLDLSSTQEHGSTVSGAPART